MNRRVFACVSDFLRACRSTNFNTLSQHQLRYYSSKNFFQSLLEKIKDESGRDTELKENIRKFREETAKLEHSKEMKSVRDFYKKIENEIPTDSVDKLRDAVAAVRNRIKSEGQNFAKHETVKRGFGAISKAGEQVMGVTKSISETEILKTALQVLEAELQSDRAKMYQPPTILQSRSELSGKVEERVFEPNTDSSGVVLHKDSKWFTAWQDFKDNNKYLQKFFDLKTQYEESDHILARSFRFLTDRASQIVGGIGSKNELQTVLDEISKMDPDFETEDFMRYCRFVLIPNVLEAIVRCDLPVLKDWCHEVPYKVVSGPLDQIVKQGFISESRVLDINHLDIQMGKMMEQGPVLIISFQAQQINCVRNKSGEVVEGDPHKILRVTHVWALCRDQSELHPWAAWRLLDIAMMPSEQWL